MAANLEETPVDQIPGIGIIRARALKKAGWPTVASLRSAKVDDLTAVPGITEVKAAQILEYIHGLEEAPAAAAPSKTKSKKAVVEKTDGSTTTPVSESTERIAVTFSHLEQASEPVAVFTIQSPRDLMQDVALSAQLLLTSEFSGRWERPFAMQLGKLITLHEKWDRYEPLGKKQTKLVTELLQKIYRLLTETPVSELTKRKSQERLTEIIRDRRRKIRDLVEG
jgi:hypothetical protein